jgi:PucR family transcriptional regulator, purine catabolism regulatory protein
MASWDSSRSEVRHCVEDLVLITLAALVRQPALGLTVLAAPEAIDREVSWVHTSELVDPSPYLESGALLLSVGLWLRPDVEPNNAAAAHVSAYVDRLVRTGVVGLGFGVGLAHETVPRLLIEAAAARHLPLIQVPKETPFIAISRAVWESLAADHYAEVTRTLQAQQELTRAAVVSGAAGLVCRLAERLDGWVVLLDAAGSVEHAAPIGAAQQRPWLAAELERLRDVTTPVSTTLSVDGDQIVVQSLRPGHRTRGFLAVGTRRRPTPEQRSVFNTAASLLTLMLAQATALQTAEAHLRTAIFDLLTSGEIDRAARLANDLWGGLPREPVRLLLVAGTQSCRDDLVEVVDAAAAVAGERVFFAQVADRLAIAYWAGGAMRDRVLSASARPGRLTTGESADAVLAELRRAHREADQALQAGLRAGRPHTSFADIGASGLLELLATPQASAFAESLLRPLIDHDAAGRGDLLRSLGAWLEHNGQWDAAAAALGVHRHTLRHRMRRVEDLLNRDLGVPAVRVELWAGVQVLARGLSASDQAPRPSRRVGGMPSHVPPLRR